MTSQLHLCAPTRVTPVEGPDTAYTPRHVADLLCRHLAAELRGRRVWEMHIGNGVWAHAAQAAGAAMILGTDADPGAPALHGRAPASCKVHDAGQGLPAGWPLPHVVLGNPPWSVAEQHLRVAFECGAELVAWVLPGDLAHRQTVWPAVWRDAWPDETIALGRLSYDGPGRTGTGSSMTDSSAYIWRRRAGSWQGRGLPRRWDRQAGRIIGPPGMVQIWTREPRSPLPALAAWHPHGWGLPRWRAEAEALAQHLTAHGAEVALVPMGMPGPDDDPTERRTP